MKATRIPLADRLFAKLEQKPDGCIEFTGHKTPTGYGRINITREKSGGAHRVAWELVHGPIPDGMCVCHSCDNPPCCNPDHLFLGTQRDNVADMMRKGRHGNVAKTECVKGHPFDQENTGVNARTGQRYCRECKRQLSRVQMSRLRAVKRERQLAGRSERAS